MKSSWTRRLTALPAAASRPQPYRRARLTVEQLEDRCVPATFTVNSTADTAAPPTGTVTLRSAITAANAAAGADTILFTPGLAGQTITLTAALPTITDQLTVTGLGQNSLTVSGNDLFRPFDVAAGVTVGISDLTVSHGLSGGAGTNGGAVNNLGTLTVDRVTVSASVANNSGGGVFSGPGAVATLTDCSLINNKAIAGALSNGGGLANSSGIVTINTSTIANNTSVFGAGLENLGTGTLGVSRSSITGNFATGPGGGVRTNGTSVQLTNTTVAFNQSSGDGGGVSLSSGSFTAVNSTIVRNTDTGNTATGAGGISKTGGTLILQNSIVAQNFAAPASTANVSGVIDVSTNSTTTGDPLLGPLQNNGGPTLSIAPLSGSPVINTGTNAAIVGITVDQRGFLRQVGALVDRGAVEFQPPVTTTTLTVAPASPTPLHLPVTLTATVAPAAASPAPNNPVTGTVTFLNGATVLGKGTLDATGKATLTLKPDQPLPAGTDALTARYDGDFNFGPSLSNVINQVVSIRKITPGVFDPATGMWFLRNTNSQGPVDVPPFQFGAPGGDTFPVVGDWTGTGVFTVGVYTRSTATFQIRFSNTPGPADVTFAFGRRQGTQTFPVAGDWSGTGKWGVGVFDASNGNWNLRNELSDGLPDAGSFLYGAPGSKPVVGDWNASGSFHIGVIEPDGTWKLKNNNTTGTPDFIFSYGGPGSTPITGDWDGNGTWTPGVVEFNGGDATWKLRNSNSAGAPDIAPFSYGGPGTLPVPGTWVFPSLPLLAAGGSASDPGVSPLDAGQLGTIVTAALGRLSAAGLDSSTLAQLASAVVEVRPLDGGQLGEALPSQNRIYIDSTAAGHGWFVDPTPNQDEEFAGGQALPGTAAAGHTDLLSVVLHEMGHLAGLPDDGGSGVMGATLRTGVRRTEALDMAFASGQLA